jgi:raffinose/stachyose/melibiose transport system substrate-binding protein
MLGLFSTVTAQEKTVVTYWTWNPAGYQDPESVVAGGNMGVSSAQMAFEAAHPDIDLQVQIYPYNDYLNQLQLNILSGTGPDIVAVQAGVLLNTYDEFFVDLTPQLEAEWGANWRDRFLSLGLDAVDSDDGVFGLPLMNSAAGFLWYNKTILDEAGLEPPTTWEEWISVSNTLSEQGISGFFHGAADSWVNYDMFIAIANEVAPGKIYQAEAGEIAWTDPDLVLALDYWQQMFNNGIMQEGALAATQYPDTHQNFSNGNAGIMLMGVWNDFSLLTNTGFEATKSGYGFTEDYQYATLAFPDLNGDGSPGRPFGGPDVIVGLNQTSENPDAAWTVLSWMLSEEGQAQQAVLLNVPAITGVPFDDSDARSDFEREVLTEQLAQLENSFGKREFLYPELKTALGDALQTVATGAQTPAEAMAAVEAVSQTVER